MQTPQQRQSPRHPLRRLANVAIKRRSIAVVYGYQRVRRRRAAPNRWGRNPGLVLADAMRRPIGRCWQIQGSLARGADADAKLIALASSGCRAVLLKFRRRWKMSNTDRDGVKQRIFAVRARNRSSRSQIQIVSLHQATFGLLLNIYHVEARSHS